MEESIALWVREGLDGFDYVLALPDGDRVSGVRVFSAFNAKLGARRGKVVTGEQAEALVRLYSLYAFADKLIVGSLDLPPGRKLRNLLGSGVATEAQLIEDVILGVMRNG